MPGLDVITLLAVAEYLVLGVMVGQARGRYGVAAPATTGDPTFERYFRAHQNTLEQLVIFIPSLWIFALWVSFWAAVILGLAYVAARAEYARGYIRAPEQRAIGAQVSMAINAILLIGGLISTFIHAL
ncbi:MAG TPA: MAPEG family protein [Candidatus Binataceae bacterium]|jgi:glutathione S-transferase|nr:MAPEG family protein [Candidatus Binataceae bacterium]